MASNDQILEHRKWPETLKIANAWWYLKKQDRDSMKIDYKICFPLIMMGIKATGFGDRFAYDSFKTSIEINNWKINKIEVQGHILSSKERHQTIMDHTNGLFI